MGKLKKLTSLLFAVSILISMMVTAPTALAVDDAKWVEKAPMAIAKYSFSCVGLNGKIYAFSGIERSHKQGVEIYDQKTNTWIAGQSMSRLRYDFVSEEVNGKIYVIGGGNGDSVPTSWMDIYDPETNTWTTGPSAPKPFLDASSAVVNGKIYVIGGRDANAHCYNTVEIFDTKTNTWISGESMPITRAYHISEAVNGKIYIIGGRIDNNLTDTLLIYDTTTNTWTFGEKMPVAKVESSSVAAGNKIYVIGGQDNNGLSNSVYIYDTISSSWTAGPAISTPRTSLGVALVNNTIYAIGGYGGQLLGYLDKVEALELSPAATNRKLAVLLNVGETAQLSVSYDLADNASLTWSTSNQAVATVDANGKVTAAGVGTCDISAQNADGTWKQSIPVRVLPGTANMYRLAVHLKPNQNAKLHLTDNPADTTWKSLDPAVATVDAAGKVTAVSQGLVIMEGTANGETKQIYVRVKG